MVAVCAIFRRYLHTEKQTIARRFLWPKQAERHGITAEAYALDDAGLESVIDLYTREAGVRELDRRIGRIARKIARQVADGAAPDRTVGTREVRASRTGLLPEGNFHGQDSRHQRQ